MIKLPKTALKIIGFEVDLLKLKQFEIYQTLDITKGALIAYNQNHHPSVSNTKKKKIIKN